MQSANQLSLSSNAVSHPMPLDSGRVVPSGTVPPVTQVKLHPYPDENKLPTTAAEKAEQQEPSAEEKTEQKRLRKEHRERWCWHPHQLRHNYATMIRKRFGIEEASNMLDHSSVKMTEVYAERDREQALEIARAVG